MQKKVIPLETPSPNWVIKVDGMPVDARHVSMESKFGKLLYGAVPETGGIGTYAGWWWSETRGGGSVTLPFAVLRRLWRKPRLVVGAVEELRPNIDGGQDHVWCAIGGAAELGSHTETQLHESRDEADLDTSAAFRLPGIPGCQDRLRYVINPSDDEGLQSFALEVGWRDLDDLGDDMHALKPAKHISGKKRHDVRFFPASKLMQTSPDLILRGAIGLLTSHLGMI